MKQNEIKSIKDHLPTLSRAGKSSNLPQTHIAKPSELIPDLMSLGTMPSRAGSVDDEKAAMRIAAEDLADLPVDKVKATIRQFRLGKLGDGWRPITAEIRKAVEARLEADARFERIKRAEAEQLQARAEARARAERLSPDSGARVRAMAAAFKASVPPERKSGWRPPTKAEAEEWLRAHEGGAGLPPVTVSDALAEKISPRGTL